MDSDLVRLHMYEAVSGFPVLDLQGIVHNFLNELVLLGEHVLLPVSQVLNDHVLFSLILHRCLHNPRLVSQVTNQQVIGDQLCGSIFRKRSKRGRGSNQKILTDYIEN